MEPLRFLGAGVTRSDFGRAPGCSTSKPKSGHFSQASPGSLSPSLRLALGPRPPAGPPSPRCQCLVPRKLSAEARTEHARRQRGRARGPEAAPTPPAPATCGVAGPRLAMDSARGPGRATWVLAGSLLAVALALPAESGNLGRLPAGPGPLRRDPSRNVPKGYSRPRSRRERSETGRCAATGWGGPAPGSSCDRSACIRETWRDPPERAQEGNRAGAGGGERLNVRIRLTSARPPARPLVLGSAAPQQPPGWGRRAVGAGAEVPRGRTARMERMERTARTARRRLYR